MTTFADDSMRLYLDTVMEAPTVPVTRFGFEWPPPEWIILLGGGVLREATKEEIDTAAPGLMMRTSMSVITDEERATMTHVFRGCEYRYARALVPE